MLLEEQAHEKNKTKAAISAAFKFRFELATFLPYNDRRKFNMSCTWLGLRLLNLLTTPLASDPELPCARIARIRSEVRPSCRKNRRCPNPHSGAVRNWSGPAAP